MIVALGPAHEAAWLAMRCALWPDTDESTHRSEMRELLNEQRRCVQFIALDDAGRGVGFVEACVRSEFVNGTTRSPVAYLEGLYVVPAVRRGGIARELVDAVVAWALEQGIGELASDVDLDNGVSQAAHEAMGFVETERVVFYSRRLAHDR